MARKARNLRPYARRGFFVEGNERPLNGVSSDSLSRLMSVRVHGEWSAKVPLLIDGRVGDHTVRSASPKWIFLGHEAGFWHQEVDGAGDVQGDSRNRSHCHPENI